MSDSANDPGECGLRERKRRATRAAISAAARTLTAARGVNGFTVEQLCEQVGISRRTFFNYFPAKEDAILGAPADDIPEDLVRRFIAGGEGAASPGKPFATLVPAFVDLAVAMVDRMALSRKDMALLKDAISAEPRLLQKAMHTSQEADSAFAAMIAAREGLAPDDPRVAAAVAAFGAIVQRAGAVFFDPENTASYRSILAGQVNATLEIFAAAQPADPDAASDSPTPPQPRTPNDNHR